MSPLQQPMQSQPPSAVDAVTPGEDSLPQQLLSTGNTNMPTKKFTDDQERGIDANLAYVEFLLAKRKKKELAGNR